ncbi:MAG: transcriptional regulator GcvA [Ferrovibrionaceae bacterium]
MTRRLPPLNQLRAFEAAARHGGFVAAAVELGVTPGAVSQQVRALEDQLGLGLFLRRPNGLVLTEAGRNLAPGLAEGLDRLAAATAQLQGPAVAGRLVVSALPAFAAFWLGPRLGRLARRLPALDLVVRSESRLIDFGRDEVDLAVRYSAGLFPGLQARKLADEVVFPACSPELLADRPPLTRLADLGALPLLHHHDAVPHQPWLDWSHWLAGTGIAPAHLARGPRFTDSATAISVAAAGQGVVLARSQLIGDLVAKGRLVRPLPDTLAAGWAYYLVAPSSHWQRPAVAAFADWLSAEADASPTI